VAVAAVSSAANTSSKSGFDSGEKLLSHDKYGVKVRAIKKELRAASGSPSA
jgi:hypothetical protein